MGAGMKFSIHDALAVRLDLGLFFRCLFLQPADTFIHVSQFHSQIRHLVPNTGRMWHTRQLWGGRIDFLPKILQGFTVFFEGHLNVIILGQFL